jgi:hypothetical protein
MSLVQEIPVPETVGLIGASAIHESSSKQTEIPDMTTSSGEIKEIIKEPSSVPNPFSGNRNAPFGIYWGTKSD